MEKPFTRAYFYDKNNNNVPDFRASYLCDCYYKHYRQLTDPIPYTEDTEDTFSKGSEIHDQEEILQNGSKNIINSEKAMKIIHKSKKYTISGHNDFLKFDFAGRYLEDLKSTKFEAFYYFLKKDIDKSHVLQLSIYAYLIYIEKGFSIKSGVITKIDKNNPRNRISRETKLLDVSTVESYLVNHPVILTVLEEFTRDQFLIKCKIQMDENETWRCDYCQYKKSCEVI